MLILLCVFFIFCSVINGNLYNNCVTYNFEKDFELLFTTDKSQCANHNIWNLGKYDLSSISPLHEASETFIYPTPEADSCVSSFVFNITTNYLVEINVYFHSAIPSDRLIILIQAENSDGPDYSIESHVLLSNLEGWQRVLIEINNPVAISANGYVSIFTHIITINNNVS